ncbi:MAG TPA: right-handed parallel beta-helix repeat-containing protein [Polyangiaceae bacterium]|jgi:hypothetical protein
MRAKYAALCLISAAAVLFERDIRAASIEIGPADDLITAANALLPGDELVLRGGTYTLSRRFGLGASGTAAAPILIRAKAGELPIVNRPLLDQNIVDVNGSYLTFQGIEFSGGSAGIRLEQASFITIQDCEVHGTADVALRANDGGRSYQGLSFVHNHIHDTGGTGEGMYIGCNTNGCQVFNSLFSGNYIHHTNGPTVSQGDGIEVKEGSYNNVISDNVIHDTGYPCIITYSTVGNGAPNIIERNLLWNCGDHAIQSAADAIIRNNIILGSNANGIAMQQHQSGAPSNLLVEHNTVFHPTNTAISMSGVVGSVVIANNALYAQSGNAVSASGNLAQVIVSGNVGVGALSGVTGGLAPGNIAVDFVSANYSGTVPMNVFPAPGSALIASGDAAYVVSDDFNGTLRNGIPDVGAYAYNASGNPGWALAAAFKPSLTSSGGAAGAAAGGAGGAAGAGGATGGIGANNAGGAPSSGGLANAGGVAGSARGGSPAAGGASASGSGGALSTPSSNQDSGCGCRVDRAPLTPSGWLLLIAVPIFIFQRRRLR